ncbi:MAG TPA: DUF1080 domain-containing protein, partial [Nitrospirales bacterium]|nr:DUF1080 domain-containing protein [Nitrospirales bacterium]
AETGERVWHFQGVHHGLWDYDFPSAPMLVDITVDGKRIKALAQTSKQGFTYVLDRATGEPVWPIVERAVPQSTVPGERTVATQPGKWQTLDITLVDRHITVILNGTKIIDNEPLLGCTGGALWSNEFRPGPLYLQGDHSAVKYRNMVLTPVVN